MACHYSWPPAEDRIKLLIVADVDEGNRLTYELSAHSVEDAPAYDAISCAWGR